MYSIIEQGGSQFKVTPGTTIRVAAANKKQASLLLAKVKEIQRNCPMVEKEIADISIGKDEAKIVFHVEVKLLLLLLVMELEVKDVRY
jgi:ribosomal protein L21